MKFKHPWWQYLLAFAFILLLLAAVFRVLTPNRQTVPATKLNQNPQEKKQSQFVKVAFSGQKPTIPSLLELAGVTTIDLTDQLKTELVDKFNLQKIGEFDVWTGNECALSLQKDSHFILSCHQQQGEVEGEINLEQARWVAKNYLADNFPQYQVSLLTNQVLFLEAGSNEYYSSDNLKNSMRQSAANKIVLPFSSTLNSYPVYFQESTLPFVELVINAQEQVTKVVFSTKKNTFKSQKQLPTLSFEVILNNIRQRNQASFIKTDHKYAQDVSLDIVEQANLSEVSLEYRIDPESNLAYPFYRFSGEFVNQTGQEFSGEIITPAVAVETE